MFYQDVFKVFMGCWHRQLCRRCFHERKCLYSGYYDVGGEKNKKKTPERQFFVLQLIVLIVTSAGQLVLCGGCFRKLLLLKTKGGMKQYSFRWKDLKWKSKGYCSRSAFRGTGCVNLKQLCDFCISRSTQMTSSVEIPQNMTDFLCHQTRCQSEVGTLSVSSTL